MEENVWNLDNCFPTPAWADSDFRGGNLVTGTNTVDCLDGSTAVVVDRSSITATTTCCCVCMYVCVVSDDGAGVVVFSESTPFCWL